MNNMNTGGGHFSHFGTIGANLGINHVDRESNHVKLTEFGGTEAEDPNE